VGTQIDGIGMDACHQALTIENPGGRGVFLMRQLSDKIHFKDNGSTVELVFRL
jgi:hypothetical protein